MVDTRTKRQKLEAMANDRSSPNEAAIARQKLQGLKAEGDRCDVCGIVHPVARDLGPNLGGWMPLRDANGIYLGRRRMYEYNGEMVIEYELV